MTDSGASSGSTAKFGDSDSVERCVVSPTLAESCCGGEHDVGALALFDEELGSAELAPSVIFGG